jgi:accessory gene regulator B
MIKRLSENIVNWQVGKSILTNKQSALYQYAYEVMLNFVINIIIAILIAITLNVPMQVFVFLVSYMPLRSYCGGYHAKTNGGCTIVSTILILVVCLMERVLTGVLGTLIIPVCFVISGVFIYVYAPAPDNNKPLDEIEIKHYRKKSRFVWLVEALIGVVLWCFGLRASAVIAISHIILSLMLVYGVFKNKKACD